MDPRLAQAISALGRGGYTPGSSATTGYVYNPLPFPGCGHVPCHRPNSPERWDLINRHTTLRGKTVLDVGCATGYFSFMSLQAGASSVLGIDHDEKAIEVCRAASAAFHVQNVTFRHGTEQSVPKEGKFDVAYAMTVLNWAGRERAETWLRWASSHVGMLWVEMPLRGDGRSGASWLHSHADIVHWLQGATTYPSITKVGQTRGPHNGQWRALIRCG